ncbi:MAG: shikimate dehydrogenase [Chloroflexi bacterium]|nr:shikimate dehydrogenase [Chloroflexota bacterium]
MLSEDITGRTRLCGIIGDPVEHSISPVMHNAAFKKLGLDYLYIPFHVTPGNLRRAMEGMRGLNISGLNVTIPHKVEVMQFLDSVDPTAEKIGAVNVVFNSGGLLQGFNTDAEGFLQPLLEKKIDPKGKNVVILGAGGASRAIAFILSERGADITILNRTSGKAIQFIETVSQTTGKIMGTLELNEMNLSTVMPVADILINATSVGMSPDSNDTLVTRDLLRPGMVVVDIVYNPFKTKLLMEAEKAGATTIGGIEMLVWQGALSFEKWTGLKAPLEEMRKAARKALKA